MHVNFKNTQALIITWLHCRGKVTELMFLHLQENTILVNLAVALEKEGISAFRFDFAGNG